MLQRTFAQWITTILIPYRESLIETKRNLPILLILDGHTTHTMQPIVELMAASNIRPCFMRPHTSHVQQPLDVGIFHTYKSAFRQAASSSALEDAYSNPNDAAATQTRVRNLARALLANSKCMTVNNIIRAFYHTGIYPLCRLTFLHFARGVLQVPDDVKEHAQAVVEEAKAAKRARVEQRGRINIVTNALVVRAYP